MKCRSIKVASVCGLALIVSALPATAQIRACTPTTVGAAECVQYETVGNSGAFLRDSAGRRIVIPQTDQGQLMLRFQLIEASTRTSPRDPAIANVDSVLRDLFRYGGYRLISEAAVAAMDGGHASQILNGGGETYSLSVSVTGPQSQGGARGGRGADAVLSASTPTRIDITLSTIPPFEAPAGQTKQSSAAQGSVIPSNVPARGRTVLQTSVTISPGHTIVLGSTQPGGPDRALILVLRPEIRKY